MAAVTCSQRTMRWSQSPAYARTSTLDPVDEHGALGDDEAGRIGVHRLAFGRVVIRAVRLIPPVRSVVAHDPHEAFLARDLPRPLDGEALLLPQRTHARAPEVGEPIELPRLDPVVAELRGLHRRTNRQAVGSASAASTIL